MDEERAAGVSTLELFFDLVFVFTLTQLTALLAAEPDAAGLAAMPSGFCSRRHLSCSGSRCRSSSHSGVSGSRHRTSSC
jgi:Bacterial low temperature requirement A protein (LtrA)